MVHNYTNILWKNFLDNVNKMGRKTAEMAIGEKDLEKYFFMNIQ